MLKGKSQLNARLRAIKQTFKPVGQRWADEDVRQNRARVPVKTGKLRDSFRVKDATGTRARVVGSGVANFIDAGTKAHDEVAHRQAMSFAFNGKTIFAKKVHKRATGPQRFKRAAALEALRKNPMAVELIKQWNNAA